MQGQCRNEEGSMAASSQDHQTLNAGTDAALIIIFCYILLREAFRKVVNKTCFCKKQGFSLNIFGI